jgi:hypothetical protein
MQNKDCNDYNQYTDVLSPDGKVIKERCFKGSLVYPPIKDFNFNNYDGYKSKDYYNYINKEFSDYKFPDDYRELTFEQISLLIFYASMNFKDNLKKDKKLNIR